MKIRDFVQLFGKLLFQLRQNLVLQVLDFQYLCFFNPEQKYLNALGYSCGTADGVFGSKTDSAVKKYQTWMKVPDGEITANFHQFFNYLIPFF